MKRSLHRRVATLLLIASATLPPAAQADFEATAPDGRKILVKDDGTWKYVETAGWVNFGEQTGAAGEAILRLERRTERGNGCQFAVRLVNDLPYEIRSLVPYYAGYRANGVVYDTVASRSAFTSIKPGDQQTREFEFVGLPCQDVARVQVVGGDRCEMGDLHKFTEGKGQCLARVRVEASPLVRFDK